MCAALGASVHTERGGRRRFFGSRQPFGGGASKIEWQTGHAFSFLSLLHEALQRERADKLGCVQHSTRGMPPNTEPELPVELEVAGIHVLLETASDSCNGIHWQRQ